MRIRFTPSARAAFLQYLAYVHRADPAAARRLRLKADRSLRRLERFPESGRKLPEFPHLPHREVIVRPCRFFYRVQGKTVWVVAVWHGARNVLKPSD